MVSNFFVGRALRSPQGAISSEEAAGLRASLSAAQGAYKLPHPIPPASASLASALFSEESPLFASKAVPDPETDLNQTNPADPTLAPSTSASSSSRKDLAASLARTLEIPLGLKLEKASLRWAGWESTTAFAGSDAAPEGGYESLVGKVLEEAKKSGTEVELDTKITRVTNDEDGVTVTDDDGKTYSAKAVIITIPLGVLKTMPDNAFEPALPAQLHETIDGTHVGTLEKLLLRYESAWWPQSDKVGSYTFLPRSTKPITEASSLREIFDGSSLVTANFAGPSLPHPSPTLLTYLSETPATALLKHNPKEVAKAFHEFLVDRLQPTDKVTAPVSSELTDWLTDPLSLGATTTPSIVSENGERSPMDFKELGRPIWDGKLGFAGEHTEMEHRGSVAGAVISGYREADRVDRLLKLKTSV